MSSRDPADASAVPPALSVTRTAAAEGAAGMPRAGASILLAEPRGFCAGVDRAIEIVERATRSCTTPTW